MSVKSLFMMFCGLLTATLIILLQFNISHADMDISVMPVGPAVRTGDITVQNIAVNLKTKQNWQLYAVPLFNSFKNTDNPAKSIPVSQAEIQDSSSSNVSQIAFGKPVMIASGNNNNNIAKNFIIRIKTPDSYYPGTYTGTILFTLVSVKGTSIQNFDLSFSQPAIMEVSTINSNVNIDVIPENSMLNNYSQEAPTPAILYIRSNKNWKLVLNGQSTYNPVSYFFKSLSETGNATVHYPDYTQLSNTNFIIAEGSPTISYDGKNIEPAVIRMNYKLTTNKYSILTAGSYPYNVVFNLISR